MTVSKPTMSPARMARLPHSWNHGLVRSTDAGRRHSIYSPPWAMFVSCSTLQSWFSMMPG